MDEPDAQDDPDDQFVERFDVAPRPRIALVVGLALAVGVMIGALVPMAVRWVQSAQTPPPPRAAEALATAPPKAPPAPPTPEPAIPEAAGPEAQVATAEPAAPISTSTPPDVGVAAPPRPAHKRAAKRSRAARPDAGGAVKASVESPCRLDSSRADFDLCLHPTLAAADQDLRQAYERALRAGLPPETLRADQAEWRAAREAAANRSPVDLAIAYQARIARVEAFAVEAPH